MKVPSNSNFHALSNGMLEEFFRLCLDFEYIIMKLMRLEVKDKKATTRSSVATQSKGKEIAKVPSLHESDHEVVSDEEETPRDKEIQKLMALISKSFKKIYKPTNNNLRTSLNIKNKSVDNTPRSDKRTDKESDDQELEAHYVYMAKIQEVTPATDADTGPIFNKEPLEKVHPNDDYNVFATERQHPEQHEFINDTNVLETVDNNITHDSSNICNDEGKVDQDIAQEEECALLASLILKVESKKVNNSLRQANTSLTNEVLRYKDSNYVKEAHIEIAIAYGLLKEQKPN
ncbi:hypothetical protein Tco_0025730 [Tanacetum coccineum]